MSYATLHFSLSHHSFLVSAVFCPLLNRVGDVLSPRHQSIKLENVQMEYSLASCTQHIFLFDLVAILSPAVDQLRGAWKDEDK